MCVVFRGVESIIESCCPSIDYKIIVTYYNNSFMSDKYNASLDEPSDTILELGNNVMYIKNKPHKSGVIRGVHHDDSPPFYTVGFLDGPEVQTIRKYLEIIPNPVNSPMKKQSYSIGEEVIWSGEGLPNNSIIIGVPSDKEGTWVDIRTNTGSRLTVSADEINRNITPDIIKSLDGIHWQDFSIRSIQDPRSIVNILAWLTIPDPSKKMPSTPDLDFLMMIRYELHKNWMLYRKFKYEWKNEDVYRYQIKEYQRNIQYIEYNDDADNTDMIVLLQATSNIIGRPIHFVTEHIPWMNVITVEPDSTISDEELYDRRVSHGENSRPDAHPIWIKHITDGYLYSNTKTKNYTHRDGGYYIGDDNIPHRFITTKEKEDANEVIKRTEQQRSKVIRLEQRSKQGRDNSSKGCCGGSARSHRKRNTRKTRKILKNRKNIKKTTHKKGRKTNPRKSKKTRKLRN